MTSGHVPAHRRLEIEGVRLHYRVAGHAPGGMPVVCLAAPGDASGSTVPLLRHLGENRLSFALDLPGHGRSSNPPYGRRDPSWWVISWLDRLRFEHCHLVAVGGSVGVAIDAAQRSPRHVSSLTVIAPPPLRRPGKLRELGHVVAGTPNTPRSPRVLSSLAARLRSQAAADFRRAMQPRDLERELPFVAAPVLVVRGERDSIIDRSSAAALARLARGTFIELPGAARACHLSHPAPIAATLERYWQSLESGGSGVVVDTGTQGEDAP